MRFTDIPLSEPIQRGIAAMGFEEATPIQERTIRPIMDGKDIIGQAQTGTGKTCAFAIPALETLTEDTGRVQVLVLCPTRELAIQTAEEFQSVSKFREGVRILPIYGGQSIDRQIMSLKKRPQIVIGTPGRIMDHMRRNTLKLDNVRLIVLDEADEMLSMGFQEDMDTILAKTPEDKQTVLFSATMSKPILELTRKYQKDPEHIRIEHTALTVPNIEQYYIEVRESSKTDALSRLIDGNNFSLCLVFCNTKRGVDELVLGLKARGYQAEALHGDMRQNERTAVMTRFRSGDIGILVATDVAARGIDVDNIEAVFNYDLPNDEEYYVHRIGRTGRAGKPGQAYTFITAREYYKLRNIQRFTKAKIKSVQIPTLPDIEESRMDVLLRKVAAAVEEDKHGKHAIYIERLLDEINTSDAPDKTTLDIAAAMLRMLSEMTSPRPRTVIHPPTERTSAHRPPTRQPYRRR